MTASINDLDFAALSPAERLLLAQELLDSVYDDLDAHTPAPEEVEWVQRRLAAVDADPAPGSPWPEVRGRLEAARRG